MTTTTAAATATRLYAGIDPSLTGTGVCVLAEGEKPFLETVSTSPKTHPDVFKRLNHIVDRVDNILFREYAVQPDDVICIERPFVNPKNMNAQQNVIVLSYLIRQCLDECGIPWVDVSPMTLKKFVCGKGTAEKSMMLMRVYQNWDIAAADDNQADAAGLAQMAKIMDALKTGGDRSGWTAYQVEAARRALEDKK